MAIKDIGSLLGADEGLNHQIVDTFATLSQTDMAWTEKIWASIARTDGSLQIDFGMGKYQNRGIIDGFGGVSRGSEQWTVRGSRELASAPEETGVGPVQMEVVEPLEQMRFRLEPNDVQPISFDIVLSGVTPPFFEERNLVRNRRTGRIDVDVIRYHQGGWASGTVTVDGETHEVRPEEWFGFRDHSWGVRQAIGEPLTDLIPSREVPAGTRGGMKWSPSFFRRPDGTYYETAIFVVEGAWEYSSAYINDADGNQVPVRSVSPRISYDTRTRYVTGGRATADDGVGGATGDRRRGARAVRLLSQDRRATARGAATNTGRGRESCTSTANTSPTAPATKTCACWVNSVIPRSASATATPSATASWKASSAVCGPNSG